MEKIKKPFIPPNLPPDLNISVFFKDIIKAREAIARYDEAIERLPNPEIVQRTFETKEAVLSSRIEGTEATLQDVLVFDAENLKEERTERQKDYREIINYRRAIFTGKRLLKKRPLAENLIKDLHKILLQSSRGSNKSPGNFRRHQVFIGSTGASIEDARFIPPPAQEIPRLFSNLEKYLHSEDVIDPLVQIAVAHYQFEAIHPFADGNGRVGRLLIPLFLYEKGITSYPNIYVSEFLEENRRDYYDLLSSVSNEEAWDNWIKFFLEAVKEQTQKTLRRITKAEELYKRLKENSSDFNSIYTMSFIDGLFIHPHFTAQQMKRISKITNNQTLYNLIEKFRKAGVIKELNLKRKRNKIYYFPQLMRIIR